MSVQKNVKNIKNEQWYVKQLEAKVKNNEIIKPKYQRKRKWDILPKKENTPSEKNYIKFLFNTQNGVHAITFGQPADKLENIDGNNRINAILHFLDEPFCIFPENLSEIFSYIKTVITSNSLSKIKEIISKMTYDELMSFKYNKYFIEKGYAEIYNSDLKNIRDEMEPYFDRLILSLKINGKDRFDTDVKININLFEGYSCEELAVVYKDINKYNSGLTEQEILASVLYGINDFVIEDLSFKMQIINFIRKFYNEQSSDEKLICYQFGEKNEKINAFDFMVAFQNYSNDKCSLIGKSENSGLCLFFKIYKVINKGKFNETFTTENVNIFINYILKVINILNKLKNNIFMENLVSKNKIFDGCNKKLNSLNKNNMCMVISCIIGYLDKNESEDNILKSIEICMLYHFFTNDVRDKDKRTYFQIKDSILYVCGGEYVEGKSKEYYKTPNSISENINKEAMKELINHLIAENVLDKLFEIRSNGKDKKDRRVRKLHEKALIWYFYRNKVPVDFLKEKFWVEHICPFSSSWEGKIDIDRLGNIFPIIDYLNSKRSNKHISEYKKYDKNNFIKFLDNVIPTINEYDEIISHENSKPSIKNSEKYDKFASANEEYLVNSFLENLYRIN